MIVGNPKQQMIYMAFHGSDRLFQMEHVDGFLTLMPRLARIGGASFQSIPIFMTKQNKVAVGGVKAVYFVKVDNEGRLTSEAEVVAMSNPSGNPAVRAMAYSEKFDRLYVAVEGTE